MTMNFQVFQRRIPRRMSDQPTATVTTQGYVSLNRAAYVALGEPVAVELLFDRADRIVGLRPTAETTAHAFPVRPHGGKPDSPVIVSVQAFARYYGIDRTVSRRYPARMDDGVLCVDLKQPGHVVTSNRARPAGSPTTSSKAARKASAGSVAGTRPTVERTPRQHEAQ